MHPTGWIGAILASRSNKTGFSIYQCGSFQPAGDAQAVGRQLTPCYTEPMEIFIQIQLDGLDFPTEAALSARDALEEALDSQRGIAVTGVGSGDGFMDIVVDVKRRQPALRIIQQLIDRHYLSAITTITVEQRTKAVVRIRAGDLFCIHLADHAWSVGLVLHKSTSFRKCVMVGFFDVLAPSPDQVSISTLSESFIAPPNYTSLEALTSELWPRIGHSEKHLKAAVIPELVASYTLYYKDTPVRQVSREELTHYPILSVAGVGAVVKQLQRYFANRLPLMALKEL